MKHIFLFSLLFLYSVGFSQETIKITYEVKNKGKKVISTASSGVLPPEVSRANTIARMNKKVFEWFTNTRYALYQKKKREETPGVMFSSRKVVTTTGGGKLLKKNRPFSYDEFETSLWDYKENYQIGIANIFKKDFRLNLDIQQKFKVVKITDEKKKILGYKVRKAILEYKNGTTAAYWFTEELKAVSPHRLEGIDGLILEIDLPHKSIKATEIDKEPSGDAIFKDFMETYKNTKVIDKDQYRDLKKEEQDENMASTREMLKGTGLNLDSIIKDVRKRVIKKEKNNY